MCVIPFVTIIMCASLAAGNSCERLLSLYESFECGPNDVIENVATSYYCATSPYKTEYAEKLCYFKGRFYRNGETLPRRYARTVFEDVCDYTCRISVELGLGPYFEYGNCDTNETIDVVEGECIHDALSNVDFFNYDWAPVFFTGDQCPFFWIADEPSDLTSDDCSEDSRTCCKYLNYTIKAGRKFRPTDLVECDCTCPPMTECIHI
ncbi:hypothetical protein PPYR_13732 [Photinus pyralis]|uniref:Uncharacterized protein n=1 Tax=Photinus pyralis TaxID=7054 RepID=A0A1Y1KXT4_PHOPY|nr:uncharacterized protein LOC116179599 [Photinus pyralis]XP_031355379.1 uncharacterized protein LOC116179699 [Photinus pyralis]KAB0794112.1 hypothetical protein PPYR_13732 [Photinus pyralis]